MHGFLSRVARLPSSSCRCRACLRTYVNGVATRPATAGSRRGLRTANAVTALYGSIFAGATIADALAKRKRRQEWDEKIAAVQEEIDELMDEERRLLESLSARKPRQSSSTAIQARSYRAGSPVGSGEARNAPSLANRAFSTKTRSKLSATEEEPDDHYRDGSESSASNVQGLYISETTPNNGPIVNESSRDTNSDAEYSGLSPESSEDDFLNLNSPAPRPEPDFIWERASIIRIRAIQKLAVQQLVFRFMLRPTVAHDYSGLPVEYRLDVVSEGSASVLLNRLRGVRRRLYSLKYIRDSKYDDLMQNISIEELEAMRDHREKYDNILRRDIERYSQGEMSLQQLLMQISDNLLSCEDPDRPVAFSLLINAFSRWNQTDLADLVIKCLLPNLFKMSTPLITAIISHFRKTKNLKDFDLFLQMLRGEGGYAVNLRTTWLKKNVNGITITVPPMGSFSPVLITNVITATLRFDQLERADAYMQLARAHGFVDNLETLTAFLRFYSDRNDFESGLSALIRALNFMVSSSEFEQDRITRLILCMADFCARCERASLAVTLVDAAVQSGFDCASINISERSDLNYLLGTYTKWRAAQRRLEKEFMLQQQNPTQEKCARFADLTAAKIIDLQHKVTGHDTYDDADDILPTLTPETIDESRRVQSASSRYVKLKSDTRANKPASSNKAATYSLESSAKIKNLRSQLEYLHQRIDKLSLSDGRDGFTEDNR